MGSGKQQNKVDRDSAAQRRHMQGPVWKMPGKGEGTSEVPFGTTPSSLTSLDNQPYLRAINEPDTTSLSCLHPHLHIFLCGRKSGGDDQRRSRRNQGRQSLRRSRSF